jgi:ParB-like chromosome segregation protein Spo0J
MLTVSGMRCLRNVAGVRRQPVMIAPAAKPCVGDVRSPDRCNRARRAQEDHVSETASATARVTTSPTVQSDPGHGFGAGAWRLGPIISDYPLKDLRPYTPRWVWPPSFKHTESYRQLLQSIRVSGVFHALLAMPDGQVVDGQHRYSCAKELGLESVPVRTIEVTLPLGDADQLAIEDWAVRDAINRRHLTRAQATQMLYDLLRGRNEVNARLARLANLKRGKEKSGLAPDPSHLTVKELAARAGKSEGSVKRALRVVRSGSPELQDRLLGGELTLGAAERAMKAEAQRNGAGAATPAPDDDASGGAPAATETARAQATPNGDVAAVANITTAAGSRTPAASLAKERSRFAATADVFLESARATVRTARVWSHQSLEQLSRALGEIESSLRDGAAKAQERTT